MSTPSLLPGSLLAQANNTAQPTQPVQATPDGDAAKAESPSLGFYAAGVLALLLIALAVFTKLQTDKLKKQIRFERFKNQELKKKHKLALETIRKMETNPDLIHSREFNLDYLRLRMDEEVFHFAIVNQLKVKVKDKISVALRSPQNSKNAGIVGISNTGRKVDTTFDVEYKMNRDGKLEKRVLFRIQIKLMKLPTQSTSTTINQIIDCIETYLSPSDEYSTWQPTIQGRLVNMHWDQQAKPTPLLVLEQLNEGVNVSFRTQTQRKQAAAAQAASSVGGMTTGSKLQKAARRNPVNADRASRGKSKHTTARW